MQVATEQFSKVQPRTCELGFYEALLLLLTKIKSLMFGFVIPVRSIRIYDGQQSSILWYFTDHASSPRLPGPSTSSPLASKQQINKQTNKQKLQEQVTKRFSE